MLTRLHASEGGRRVTIAECESLGSESTLESQVYFTALEHCLFFQDLFLIFPRLGLGAWKYLRN